MLKRRGAGTASLSGVMPHVDAREPSPFESMAQRRDVGFWTIRVDTVAIVFDLSGMVSGPKHV